MSPARLARPQIAEKVPSKTQDMMRATVASITGKPRRPPALCPRMQPLHAAPFG